MNRGVLQVNRGVLQVNRGVLQVNRGVLQVNRGFTKKIFPWVLARNVISLNGKCI